MNTAFLRKTAFLFITLCVAQTAKPQANLPPVALAEKAKLVSPADVELADFLHSAAEAVIHLEAIGERTVDAIENTQTALTFDSNLGQLYS